MSAWIVHTLATATGCPPRYVFFANVHTIHIAQEMSDFRQAVNDAELVLPDGSGLAIAGRILGSRIRSNLNGTDFAPKLFRYAEDRGCSLYLLGGRSEVVGACREILRMKYPRLNISGFQSGYFNHGEEQQIIDDINACRPDILLVALGSPLQELWVARHQCELNARVCFAVGGLFDFVAGVVPRAPAWMRGLGMEWLYRFIQDPVTKWRRVFVEIPAFLGLVASAWVGRQLRATGNWSEAAFRRT
jgi:N-acetylglucosaminyldiphosphoundecaprenol N-acetyl-beta-D-mannosaminyltransferase